MVTAPGAPRAPAPIPLGLRGDYAHCLRLARSHDENFPVASTVLPAAMRPHIAAIYAFARGADDEADEGRRPAEERLRALDAWRTSLWASAAGEVREAGDDLRAPIFRALAHTIASCHLPVQLFDDLLSAFAQDVTTTRCQTWSDLFDYCRRSANPVGRLVLRVAGYRRADLDDSSDALCTALQLTNFWQDLDRDWRKGRLYVPLEEAAAAGAEVADFDPASLSPEWRVTLERAAGRTRDLFLGGRAVCDGVAGRLRLQLRLTWLGGVTILDRLAAVGFDVVRSRPAIRTADAPLLLWKAWRWGK